MVQKKQLKISDFNVNNIVISKLVETKPNSNYLIGYLDKVRRPLVLILPKGSRYVKAFQAEDGNKYKNNKLISFCMDDEKL